MMLTKLSNQELEARLKYLVGSERRILHSILEHINEVDSRKLYLEKAYSSLYEYLVKECHYSGSAAMRRIAAARLLKEVPAVAEKIQSGDLNLSQIGELTRAIKEKQKSGQEVSGLHKQELISAISGKTTYETQKEISVSLDLALKAPEKKTVQKDNSVHLQITLTQEQYEALLKCKDLAAHVLLSEYQDVSLASVIGHLANHYLKPQKDQTLSPSEKMAVKVGSEAKNKTLTPKVRRAVLQRDECCQFKDPKSGKICGSTFALEVDHKRPQWDFGDHEVSNLQVLCRSHNNHKYKKESNLRLL